MEMARASSMPTMPTRGNSWSKGLPPVLRLTRAAPTTRLVGGLDSASSTALSLRRRMTPTLSWSKAKQPPMETVAADLPPPPPPRRKHQEEILASPAWTPVPPTPLAPVRGHRSPLTLTPHPSPSPPLTLTPHPRPSPLAPRPSPIAHRPSPITPHPSPLTPRPWPLATRPSPLTLILTLTLHAGTADTSGFRQGGVTISHARSDVATCHER